MAAAYGELLKEHISIYCGENPCDVFHESLTGIKVAKFKDIPEEGLVTFLSVGLSGHLLQQDSGRKIRQEFLITIDENFAFLDVEDVIFSVAKLVLDRHIALKQGELLGPRGSLFEDESCAGITSMMCGYPAYFPDGFAFFEMNDEVTVFVELILLTTQEASLAKDAGWSALMEEISKGVINILDLTRG